MSVSIQLGRSIYIFQVRSVGCRITFSCARPTALASGLSSAVTKINVGGLRDESCELPTEKAVNGETLFPSKQAGFVWRRMCTADVSRGNGTLQVLNVPADTGRLDLLLCTWPRFVASGQADDWLACQSDPLWAQSGVPLGGIGGGRVDICRDGRFRNFSMNNNQDAPLEDPDGLKCTGLSISCDRVHLDLATRPIFEGHGIVPTLRYDARFPQAKLFADNAFDGIDVEVTFSGTLVPHNLVLSSIPGFLVKWKVVNRSDRPQKIACAVGWPNLIGVGGGVSKSETKIGQGDGTYAHWSEDTGRVVELIADRDFPDIAAVRFAGAPTAEHVSSSGSHILAALGGAATTDGSHGAQVSRTLEVPAGSEAFAIMSLVTAMPDWIDSRHEDRGTYWQNSFDAKGSDDLPDIQMTNTLLEAADALFEDTAALANHLADSTLPEWLTGRLSNCCYPLVTNSVLYKDGRFSINEGPTEMIGCYGTIDQRLAAHPATQLLFPSLNAQELSEFAAIQAPNGGISHDLGHGHLERGPSDTHWPDLTCSFVIQTARHAWSTGDKVFEDAMYPRAVMALRRHAEWSVPGGGVAQLGDGLGTSYDSHHYYATTGYMATLWIAALNIGEEWARRRGDDAIIHELVAWREAAVKRLEADLWNGKYYDAYGNGADISRKTCHAGQIAGQQFTVMLTGLDVLPPDRLDSVIDSLLTLNGSDRYAVPPDEVAPDGSVGSDFCWLPYVEGFMLTAIATRGDDRMWPIWERMIEATYADGKTPCDTRLMYVPETGAQTWGTYYMTAPASWLVYDAWTGFFHDADIGLIRFRSLAPGRYPIVAPLFWATLEVDAGGRYALRVKRTFANALLTLTSVEMRDTNGVSRIELPPQTTIAEDEVIEWASPR